MKLRTTLTPVWLIVLTGLTVCRDAAVAYDWLPPTNKVTLLAFFTHPDDEGIFGGGSLPYYSKVLQVPTMLVGMTAGAGAPRDDELRSAAWSYGLRYEPVFGHFLDILSNSLTNTPYGTNTIDVTWDCWSGACNKTNAEAGKAKAINFVAEQIRRYRPDVIITHDLNGETGHDNHKATAYAVTRGFWVAADPNATATNLVGLPPWQAQKLYVHLYPTNRLFHQFWEAPYPALTNLTPRQAANTGLTFHVSQGPLRWTCASVYPPTGMYNPWPAEWWGLYASMVGPDDVLTTNAVVNGYPVPAGVAVGDFLQHLPINELYFTAIPNSATVVAGTSITMSSTAVTTVPPLGYQWQLNGVSIPDATSASLTLSNPQPTNAGSYTVVVTNAGASITCPPAALTVLVPPVIIFAPQSRTNLAGTVATFAATASGSGPLSYQWLLNGVSLQNGSRILGANASTLEISGVQPADAGNVILAVSNPAGTVAAPTANLVVRVPPPCVPAPPGLVSWWPADGDASDLTGAHHGALLGSATAAMPGKLGQAFWFDGTNSSVAIPDSPTLKPAEFTVEAWVSFSALDSPGSGGSPAGQQYLVFKQNTRSSSFEGYSMTKARTGGGDVISFTVSSASGQVAKINSTTAVVTGLWYHVAAERGSNFTRLYVNGQLEGETSVAFPQDYGTNALFFGTSGQSYWDHKLSGMLDEVSLYSRALSAVEIGAIYTIGAAGKCHEAAIAIQPQSQFCLPGSNVTLSAVSMGPGLSYQWFFNQTNLIAGATNATLFLTSLNPAQTGNYSVLVSNLAGAVLSQPALLTVGPVRGIIMPLRLAGAIGSSWRVDYANDLGPGNNWAPLAMVTLTNTLQVYSDTTALGQPHRFYRVVPLP